MLSLRVQKLYSHNRILYTIYRKQHNANMFTLLISLAHNYTYYERFYWYFSHKLWTGHTSINTLRPRQNGRHFPDDIFKWIFLNENVWISVKISLKYVPKGPINNIPALVQIMAWRRSGDKPLSEPMMVGLPTHIYESLGLNELTHHMLIKVILIRYCSKDGNTL